MVKYKNASLLQYKKELKQIDSITYKQSEELYGSYKKGNLTSREILIRGSLKNIFTMLEKMATSDEELLEFISLSNVYLLQCLEEYKVNKNSKSTFLETARRIIYSKITLLQKEKASDTISLSDMEIYIENGKEHYRNIGNNIAYDMNVFPTVENIENNLMHDLVLEMIERSTYDFSVDPRNSKNYLTENQRDFLYKFMETGSYSKIAKEEKTTRSNAYALGARSFKKLRKIKAFEELCEDMDIPVKNKNIKANVKLLEKKR